MVRVIGVFSLLALTGSASYQPGDCAPPERRTMAIQIARQINTAEAAAYRRSGRYVGVSELSVPAGPEGFQVQLSTDASAYTFSVKDTLDACHSAMFSDQDGIIYAGAPIR